MSDQPVSIILRSFNEGWALRDTLAAVAAQEYGDWELIVIDSGSTDGSVELIRAARPRHFVQIAPHEYHPARVLNRGMELASSEVGIFLNADATPQGNRWLRPLVEALRDPQVAAVFGRQIPRPNCHAVFAHDYDRCFGPKRASAHWDHFFSMVSSGIRKDIWARRGFDVRMTYSEDDEYTRWCRAQGYRIVYVPESVAMHSHNYTPAQAYKRSYGEARALAAVWRGDRDDFNWLGTVGGGWLNDIRRDLGYCLREKRWREWPHAARIRWQQRRARLAGFRAGWAEYREQDLSGPAPPLTMALASRWDATVTATATASPPPGEPRQRENQGA
jgi:rhamnosyltransferase